VGQATKINRREVLEKAWIGDAVLSLHARQRILSEGNGIDNEKAIRMTSNKFLQIVGEASEVEARIGWIYEREGLEAAFAWIERELMPLHEKQERRISPPPRAKTKV
jgi:dsRNA-specific ribonuclease